MCPLLSISKRMNVRALKIQTLKIWSNALKKKLAKHIHEISHYSTISVFYAFFVRFNCCATFYITFDFFSQLHFHIVFESVIRYTQSVNTVDRFLMLYPNWFLYIYARVCTRVYFEFWKRKKKPYNAPISSNNKLLNNVHWLRQLKFYWLNNS